MGERICVIFNERLALRVQSSASDHDRVARRLALVEPF